jgi:hypothetical protein
MKRAATSSNTASIPSQIGREQAPGGQVIEAVRVGQAEPLEAGQRASLSAHSLRSAICTSSSGCSRVLEPLQRAHWRGLHKITG